MSYDEDDEDEAEALVYDGSIEDLEVALRSRALCDAERDFLKDNLHLAKLRSERANARKKEIDNEARAGSLIFIDDAQGVFESITRALRSFGEALRQQFGNDAVDLWNDHLAVARESVAKGLPSAVAHRQSGARYDTRDSTNRTVRLGARGLSVGRAHANLSGGGA